MKENVIEVLMYLFDNYLSLEEELPIDEVALTNQLEQAGFHTSEITKAFDWLGELAKLSPKDKLQKSTCVNCNRIYTPEEMYKLNPACRGFLVSLQDMGLLDDPTRELIIERSMAIQSPQLNLQQFKRVVGLVMLNNSEDDEIFDWIDEIIFDEIDSVLH